MDMKTIRISRNNLIYKGQPSVLGRFLPLMLIVSFAFANFYSATQAMIPELYAVSSAAHSWFFVLYLIFMAVIDYVILLGVLWVYRTILGHRPYFYLVKTQTFNEHFKFWYFVKNVLYGLVSCILFVCPYLHIYLPVINLILTFGVILFSYISLSKQIDIMFKHMYFKLLMYPWFIFEIINIVITIFTGGY